MEWRSLVDTCTGMALNFVMSSQLPCETKAKLREYFQADGLAKKGRIHSMAIGPGEDPTKVVLRGDDNASEQASLRIKFTEDVVIKNIRNGLSDECDE